MVSALPIFARDCESVGLFCRFRYDVAHSVLIRKSKVGTVDIYLNAGDRGKFSMLTRRGEEE